MWMIDEALSLSIPLEELTWEYARSGGPGGQNVNKVNSKATLRFRPSLNLSLPNPVRERLLVATASRLTGEGELLISSQLTRDQERNREDCLNKLRTLILTAARPPKPRRATKPTRASQENRLETKKRRSETKQQRRDSFSD